VEQTFRIANHLFSTRPIFYKTQLHTTGLVECARRRRAHRRKRMRPHSRRGWRAGRSSISYSYVTGDNVTM
jgi:hypothetical protein